MKTELTNYLVYSPDDQAQTTQTIVLQNVEIPGHQAPPEGLTSLYGRSTVALLSRVMQQARTAGQAVATVKLEVDIGDPPYRVDPHTGESKKAVRATLELLPQLKAINLRKISTHIGVEDLVANRYRKYLQEEGSPLPEVALPNFGLVAARPDLIHRLHQEPEFAHLGLIIYPVLDEHSMLHQFATLFDPSLVIRLTTSPPKVPFQVVLPV